MLLLPCSKDRPETFGLPDNFGLFPQFMFHLRRSNLLQVGLLVLHTAADSIAQSTAITLMCTGCEIWHTMMHDGLLGCQPSGAE